MQLPIADNNGTFPSSAQVTVHGEPPWQETPAYGDVIWKGSYVRTLQHLLCAKLTNRPALDTDARARRIAMVYEHRDILVMVAA